MPRYNIKKPGDNFFPDYNRIVTITARTDVEKGKLYGIDVGGTAPNLKRGLYADLDSGFGITGMEFFHPSSGIIDRDERRWQRFVSATRGVYQPLHDAKIGEKVQCFGPGTRIGLPVTGGVFKPAITGAADPTDNRAESTMGEINRTFVGDRVGYCVYNYEFGTGHANSGDLVEGFEDFGIVPIPGDISQSTLNNAFFLPPLPTDANEMKSTTNEKSIHWIEQYLSGFANQMFNAVIGRVFAIYQPEIGAQDSSDIGKFKEYADFKIVAEPDHGIAARDPDIAIVELGWN